MILTLATWVMQALGLATAVAVVWVGDHRSRGAAAWVIALLVLPWVAVPLYWLSGQVRYRDFARSQSRSEAQFAPWTTPIREARANNRQPVAASGGKPSRSNQLDRVLARFSEFGGSVAASCQLLHCSEHVYPEMLEAIQEAERYVLLQSYLLRDDRSGEQFAEALVAAANRGCKVFVLIDELGSFEISPTFTEQLRRQGVVVRSFTSKRRLLPKLRANFRNHRKTLVVDGRTSFLGGLNIGDEYVDGADEFDGWRDTHLRLEGDPVLDIQMIFLRDWQFASKHHEDVEVLPLHWGQGAASAAEQDANGPERLDPRSLVVEEATFAPVPEVESWICAIGPHERFYTGDILFNELLGSATKRLWIATPYFVPDDRIVATLKGAALRGADVRIIVPRQTDHFIFRWVHRDLVSELKEYGIKIFFYENGFMHQKVLLVDHDLAAVGSANFDNRSMRLNFEIVAILRSEAFAAQMARMLTEDFAASTPVTPENARSRGTADRFLTRLVRLASPIL